jgi:hypothetical protein
LWPIDCLDRGSPLEAKAASSVDDLGYVWSAGVFHEHCRASSWNNAGIISRSPEVTLSFHINCLLVPAGTTEGTDLVMPLFVINPGLESV